MSLINQMLKDLDARRAAGSERSELPGEVRFLPAERRSSWRLLAAGAAALVAATAAALWWLRPPQPAPVAPGPQAAARLPADTAVAKPPAAAAPERKPPVGPQAESAPAIPAAPAATERSGTQTQSAAVSAAKPTAVKRAAKAAVEPVAAKSATPVIVGARPAPPTAAGKQAATETMRETVAEGTAEEPPPRIEKRVREATAHERAENHLHRGLGLLNQGRVGEAMAGLRVALHEEPGHTRARLALSGILIEGRKLAEARELLGEGLALDAAQPALALPMARIQAELGDLPGAERTLAAAAAGASAEQNGFHAGVLQRLARHEEAIGAYREALRLAPGAGVWWMGLAISLEAAGQPAQAREAYARAKSSGSLSPELAGFVDAKLRALK
ncbi:MAG: hypothetical protein AUK49_13115 [Betaproteobacteria bacterium CG2_30_68_42]|nr:MAG: hypothetical protein AUK49_13115 [Betaproteobacteria bacterium CG2_30_68_42]